MKQKFKNPFGGTFQQQQKINLQYKPNQDQQSQHFSGNISFKQKTYSNNFDQSAFQQQLPLLQDLGINLQNIKSRIIAVITMTQLDQRFIQNTDMTGPIFIIICLGTFILLSGKIHFGEIYGVSLFGTFGLWFMMNFLSQQKRISVYTLMSILGYSLLPLILLSALNVIMDMRNILGMILSLCCMIWATIVATSFIILYLQLHNKKWLVSYPIFLFYLTFVLITIF